MLVIPRILPAQTHAFIPGFELLHHKSLVNPNPEAMVRCVQSEFSKGPFFFFNPKHKQVNRGSLRSPWPAGGFLVWSVSTLKVFKDMALNMRLSYNFMSYGLKGPSDLSHLNSWLAEMATFLSTTQPAAHKPVWVQVYCSGFYFIGNGIPLIFMFRPLGKKSFSYFLVPPVLVGKKLCCYHKGK